MKLNCSFSWLYLFCFSSDNAIAVSDGQSYEGSDKGHVTDECKNESATTSEDHDGL